MQFCPPSLRRLNGVSRVRRPQGQNPQAALRDPDSGLWDKFLVRNEDQELGCLGFWGWVFGISRARVSWSLASLVQIRASPCLGRCWPSPY